MKKILNDSLKVGEEKAIKSIKTATGQWKGIFFENGIKEDKPKVYKSNRKKLA